MGLLSQHIIPEWRQPELALFTSAALGFVKHATRSDAAQGYLVLRQKISPHRRSSAWEGNDRPNTLALLHSGEAVVNLGERNTLTNQLIEFQLSLEIVLGQKWEVARRTRSTITRSCDLFLAYQRAETQRYIRIKVDLTKDDDPSSRSHRFQGLLQAFFVSGRIKAVICPTPCRQVTYGIHCIVACRIDRSLFQVSDRPHRWRQSGWPEPGTLLSSTLRPTAPHPKTATLEPGETFATRATAPTPVITPQPIRQARSNGMSLETGMAPASGTTQYSACDETKIWWWSFAPLQLSLVQPSMSCPLELLRA